MTMRSLAVALAFTVLSVPITALAQGGPANEADSQGEAIRTGAAYVTADRLDVRLAPNRSGKITNVLDRGQKVNVLEVQGEWARISRYYDGSIEGVSGGVARWVASSYLSHSESFDVSVDRALRKSLLDKALSISDDFHEYSSTFLAAAEQLVDQRRCTVKDFEIRGGWRRSRTRGSRFYYVVYGGVPSRRIYLNVRSGKVSAGSAGSVESNRALRKSVLDRALSTSDDFRKYRATFLAAAEQLLSERRCTVKDFEEWGGWIRSATHGWPLYFTFCGGAHISNRIYLNVRNGRVSR